MRRSGDRQSGNIVVEFTLIGIPVIFVLISVFEVARGLWVYHTLAHAVKEGLRYAIVHGNNCNIHPNSCAVQIRAIAARVRESGVGLVPEEVRNVSFQSLTRTHNCAKLSDCLALGEAGNTYWPAAAPGAAPDLGGARKEEVEMRAEYQFRSAIAMFWPGTRGINFATVTLGAMARERIQY